MADVKISALNALGAAPAAADLIPVVDVSGSETKKLRIDELFTNPNVTGTVTADGLTVDAASTDLKTTGFTHTLNFNTTTGTQNTNAQITSSRTDISTSKSNLRLKTNDGTSTLTRMEIDASGDISFYEDTGTTAKFFWDASAESLGIGTTSPSSVLTVDGNSTTFANSGLVLKRTGALTGSAGFILAGTSGSEALTVNVNATERMRIDSSGNVGIGTSSPSTRLHVNTGSAGYGITVAASSQTSGTYQIGIDSNSALAIYDTAATAQRLVLSNAGNVGIGTASPSGGALGGKVVHVESSGETASVRVGRSDASTSGTLSISSGNTSNTLYSTGSKPLIIYTDSSERARIDASGNLLVGKSASSGATTGVEARVTGVITAVTNSSSPAAVFNRNDNDGTIVEIKKSNATAGVIGTGNTSRFHVGSGDVGFMFAPSEDAIYPWDSTSNAQRDAAVTLGYSSHRFKDLYLSGGVVFGTGGAAKTLDDYEEGTWTPTISTSINPFTGLTYAAQVGHYTKVGNRVTIDFNILVNGLTAAGTGFVRILGLPFTANEGLSKGQISLINTTVDADVVNIVLTNRAAGSTELTILANRSATSSKTVDGEDISSASQLIGSITYQVA